MLRNISLFGTLIIWSVTVTAQINIAIDPSAQAVALGNQAVFNFDVNGLGNGTALGTYDLTVHFDPTVLAYVNTSFGNQLDLSGFGDIQSVTPNTDNVEVYELSLDSFSLLNSSQAPGFTLATLYFDTLSLAANSPLSLSINALGDVGGNSLSAGIQSSTVTVNTPAVPIPATVWLFSSVLAGLGFLNRGICNRG